MKLGLMESISFNYLIPISVFFCPNAVLAKYPTIVLKKLEGSREFVEMGSRTKNPENRNDFIKGSFVLTYAYLHCRSLFVFLCPTVGIIE